MMMMITEAENLGESLSLTHSVYFNWKVFFLLSKCDTFTNRYSKYQTLENKNQKKPMKPIKKHTNF